MGIAFDQACRSFRNFANLDRVRELVAKRIIEAAKRGERDPIRLQWQAVMGRSFDDVPMPADNVGRKLPSRLRVEARVAAMAEGPAARTLTALLARRSPVFAHVECSQANSGVQFGLD